MTTLRDIDKNNWEECIDLKPSEEQRGFMASNLYSIAESKFLPGFVIKAIYIDEDIVGFAMYGLDPDDGNYWIYRFMIDERFQRHGFGVQSMQLIIDDIRSREDRTDVIMLGYQPNNENARKLYAKVGFVEEGIAPWGEMLAKYSF